MPLSLTVEVVTEEKNIYSGPATMVVAPGSLGELAILPNHSNLLTALSTGKLKVYNGQNENSIAIVGGFLQISDNKVIVLADSAEISNNPDKPRN
jgi:F-type H+-transporting ATPase subunit epsilon